MSVKIKKVLLATVYTLALLAIPAMSLASVGADINEQLRPVETNVFGSGQPRSLGETVSEIIKVALGFLGIVFLLLTIYAGFTWMLAAGNEDKISTAKKTLVAAVIGLAIVLASYAITRFVIDGLLEATGVN